MNIIKFLKKNMNIIRKNGSYIEKNTWILEMKDYENYEIKYSLGLAG